MRKPEWLNRVGPHGDSVEAWPHFNLNQDFCFISSLVETRSIYLFKTSVGSSEQVIE